MIENKKRITKGINFHDLTLNTLLVATILFWWIVSWPINMSPDSLDIWSQIKNNSYTNSHPVTYTIFVKIISINGTSLSLVSLVQLCLFTFAIYLTSFSLTSNKKISKFITTLIILIPTGGSFATTLWKDVPFTSFLLLGFSLLAFNKVKKNYILAFSFLTIGASFRHNGFFLLLVICLIMLIIKIIYKKLVNPITISIIILSSIMSIFLLQTVVKVIDAKPIAPWLTWSPMLADLAYVASRTENTNLNEIHEIVSTYSKDTSLQLAADCTSVNGLIFSEGFDDTKLISNLPKIQKEYLKFIYNSPEIFSRLHFCRANSFIPPPFSKGPNYYYWTQLQIIQPNNFGLQQNSPIKLIRNIGIILWDIWNENGNLLLWPGLFALLSLFCVNQFKSRVVPYWLIISWSSLLSLIPWSNAQDFRYAEFSYSVFLILIFSKLIQLHNRFLKLFFQSS